jgi:hypothetical protein
MKKTYKICDPCLIIAAGSSDFRISNCFANPFNSSTCISFDAMHLSLTTGNRKNYYYYINIFLYSKRVLDINFVLDDQWVFIIINYYDNLIIIGMANVRDHNFILLPSHPSNLLLLSIYSLSFYRVENETLKTHYKVEHNNNSPFLRL